MLFFVDTADVEIIKELAAMGMLDGVTTNPSLIAKSKQDFKTTISQICKIVKGPVSAEVVAVDYEDMIKEGKELSKIAKNVTVKLPLTQDGLKACRYFTNEGIMTNMTLCFSPAQALLAAKAGATFVSPFIGRLDDISHDGLGLIEEICQIYANYPNLKTQVLVASIRNPRQITEAGLLGAHVVTMPPQIIKQLVAHPLTDKGLEMFLKDWEQTGQSILQKE